MSLFDDASLVLTPNGYKASKLYSIKPTSGLGDMVVSRNTTATRVNSLGLLESVAFNVPRLDYTGGGCPRILVEPARTNLVLQSQTLENASWGKLGTGLGIAPVVTANAGTAPDGTMTAERVQFNCVGSLAADRSILLQGSLVTTIATRYYQSIYVKAFSSGEVGKKLRIAADGLTGLSSVITITADWQRIVLNGLANATTTNFIVETRGTFTTPTNTTADVLLWGAQMEAGSNATSYIPTTTLIAGVTRNADVISKTGISSLIGQTEGTIFIDAQITNFAEAAQSFITISNGTIFNRIELRKDSSSQIILEGAASTGSFPSFTLSSVAVGRYKIAIAYQSGNSYLYINGAQVGTTSANAFAFTSLTNIVVGANATGSTRFLNDRINLATVFPTRLLPGQLATLTTL